MKRAFPVLLAVVLLLFALLFAQAEEDALQTVLVAVDPATLPEEQAALLIPADPETEARVLDSAPVCPETDAAFRDPENAAFVLVAAQLVYTDQGITAVTELQDGTMLAVGGHAAVEGKGEFLFAPAEAPVLHYGFEETADGRLRFYATDAAAGLIPGQMAVSAALRIGGQVYVFDENGYALPAEAETEAEELPETTDRTENPDICTEHDTRRISYVEAGCTEAGLAQYRCAQCGHVLKYRLPAMGHREETVPGKAAACTEDGLTEGKICSVCGEVLTAQETIPATGHTEETVPGKAATCTEDGLTEGKTCSVCGEVLTAQETIPATGHTEETIPGKAAKCTEPGLTDGIKCSVCGEILKEQEEIPATGHTEETIPGKAAKCTEPGLTDGIKCSACGEILKEQEEIPAIGRHDWTITSTMKDSGGNTVSTLGEATTVLAEKHCSRCEADGSETANVQHIKPTCGEDGSWFVTFTDADFTCPAETDTNRPPHTWTEKWTVVDKYLDGLTVIPDEEGGASLWGSCVLNIYVKCSVCDHEPPGPAFSSTESENIVYLGENPGGGYLLEVPVNDESSFSDHGTRYYLKGYVSTVRFVHD